MHVDPVGGVDRLAGLLEELLAEQVQVLERAQRAQVEDRAQVDEEALGALAGEDLLAGLQLEHRVRGEPL